MWKGGPYSVDFPEREAARQVAAGVLRVDPDGSVWRLRRHSREGDGTTYPIEPRRIDYGPPGEHRIIAIRIGAKGDRRDVKVQVARLVWQLHKGDIPPKLTVNHKDGDPTHNTIDNFELATHSEQHKHRYRVLGQKSAHEVREGLLIGFVNAAEEALTTGDWEPIRAALKAYQERPIRPRTRWYAAKKERERLAKKGGL
jgi:hypothetical protein